MAFLFLLSWNSISVVFKGVGSAKFAVWRFGSRQEQLRTRSLLELSDEWWLDLCGIKRPVCN